MENSVVTTKCGFGYHSIGETECNFYLKGDEGRILASFINGVCEIFDNFVDCNIYDESQSNWNCNDFLLNDYLGKDIKVVFADLEPSGQLNYLAVECNYNQARQILQNFLDCYGEMQIVTEC